MQDDPKNELIERFIAATEYLNRQMRLHQFENWIGLDMTLSHAKTMNLLDKAGPLRMGALAASLGFAVSAMTTVVDRLVERGFVERLSDPNDRRVVICNLTSDGREAVSRCWRIGEERLQPVTAQLDAAELERIVEAFETICRLDPVVGELVDSAPSEI